MPAHKLYKTAAEKNAAKKANYQRYYEKHKESINERRRSQYNNPNGEVLKMQLKSGKDDHKDASPPGRSTHRQKSTKDSTPKDSSRKRPATNKGTKNSAITQKSRVTSRSEKPALHEQSSPHVAQYHPNMYERTLGLRLAKQSLEAYYDSYIEALGGNWTRFFDRLSDSFIKTGNPDEIDEAFDNYKRTELCLAKRFKKLQEEAIMLGDYEAIKEGRGMVERVKEVGEKLHEFYTANMHGSEDFKERVESGDLKW